MRQGENFEDATQLTTRTQPNSTSRRRLWRGGVVETFAALVHRDRDRYDDWLDERDTVIIAAALSRLSDRQLGRIGLSRQTLVLGIEDLKRAAERNRQIGHDTLEIIEDTETGDAPEAQMDPRKPANPHTQQMAAE